MSKRRKVVERIWDVLHSSLVANGFQRKSGPHAYRDREATIDVLKIEFFDGSTHRVWGTSTHSFGISCGVYLKFAPDPFGGRIAHGIDGALEPDGTLCAIRTHLHGKLRQSKNVPQNIWPVADDLANLDPTAIDVGREFEDAAVRWFDQFESVHGIAKLLLNAEERLDGDLPCFGFGKKGSPVRNLYLGFAAATAGDHQAGHEALVASLSKGGFARLSGSSAVDDLVRRKLAELQ